jgi:hypothetical protein
MIFKLCGRRGVFFKSVYDHGRMHEKLYESDCELFEAEDAHGITKDGLLIAES